MGDSGRGLHRKRYIHQFSQAGEAVEATLRAYGEVLGRRGDAASSFVPLATCPTAGIRTVRSGRVSGVRCSVYG